MDTASDGRRTRREAARYALDSPLIERRIKGAIGVLLSIVGAVGPRRRTRPPRPPRRSARRAGELEYHPRHLRFDEMLGDQLWVTVIATGFERSDGIGASASPSARATARRCASSRSTTISTSRPSCATRHLPGCRARAPSPQGIRRRRKSGPRCCARAARPSMHAWLRHSHPGSPSRRSPGPEAEASWSRSTPRAGDRSPSTASVAVPGEELRRRAGGAARAPTSSISAPASRSSSWGRGRAPCPA